MATEENEARTSKISASHTFFDSTFLWVKLKCIVMHQDFYNFQALNLNWPASYSACMLFTWVNSCLIVIQSDRYLSNCEVTD